MNIRLRNVEPADLPALFEQQCDPESNRLAAVIPRNSETFHAHWTNVLADPKLVVKAILADGHLVGTVCCFNMKRVDSVGYWIAREYWGRGIAGRALGLLLEEVSIRPLHARVARHNLASIRVLEKNGFAIVGREYSPGDGRFLACEEVLFRLE